MTGPKIREVDFDADGFSYVCRAGCCVVSVTIGNRQGGRLWIVKLNGETTGVVPLAEQLGVAESTIRKRIERGSCLKRERQKRGYTPAALSTGYQACPVAAKFLGLPRPQL